ncbi:phosphoribosylamine--glycine ligase [Alteribacter keqinensis]|uniref:Phosphoribosylamine--glycine ligase n=1 Tax=Alteribacter keqinensis TaxID=2483800 RepID=A0A3M7TPX6_9BACI|nr:phosphoribosylamine--glycine ligase [Alteribacter keqinensis]RNA66729.1 phosphoribosylamine--glycine ligase [Alteribacter keqinensis]
MKVLVIGKGGREHVLCWSFAKSPNVKEVIALPGSDGISSVARCVDIAEDAHEEIVSLVKKELVDLVVIGPEAPLVAGLGDRLTEEGIRVFGPSQQAARVEGSKEFAKEMMRKYDIPTGEYDVFDSLTDAKAYVENKGTPIVIKADGLAAGKGVVVAMNEEQAMEALEQMLDEKHFGEAGSRVVIEEYLEGEECSLMAFVNGETVIPMVPAQDHKRAYDGDRGPNTGGMGAYSPVPHISNQVIREAETQIVRKMAYALKQENSLFTGVLYAGLMITKDGPKVIEFNARFGDPEAQVVLPRLLTPLDEVIFSVLKNQEMEVEWSEEAVMGVVLASEGYPGPYENGVPVNEHLLSEAAGPFFHAGTKKTADGWITAGGRVGIVTSMNTSLLKAQQAIYSVLEQDPSEGLFYRSDIGSRAISASYAGASSPDKKQ